VIRHTKLTRKRWEKPVEKLPSIQCCVIAGEKPRVREGMDIEITDGSRPLMVGVRRTVRQEFLARKQTC